MRVRPLGPGKREAKYAVWSIADITRDRERQEDVFQELQHAIEYLDHAPCGFFSVDPAGDIVYVNATLANWLDHDLAEIGSGGLKLTDIVSGDGASLLTSIAAVPGEVKTEVFDIDLRMRGGKTMPVRLYHKLAFGADGAPGASRTLVINRARDERSDPQRAAEVRFMRFFDHTPMAIATVDRAGAVVRANALLRQAGARPRPRRPAASKSIFRTVNARDRSSLIAAIRQAAEGQGEIAPVEAMLDGAQGALGALLRHRGRGGRARDRGRHRLYARDHRAAHAGEPDQPVAEDGDGRPARRRHRARLQQRAVRHHDGERLPAERAQADRSVVPGHHADQAERQPRRDAGAAAAGVLAQADACGRRCSISARRCRDLTMLLRRLIGEKVKLDLVHGRDLWPVKADVSQFEQVIVNLAVNARDAMPDGGKLTVRTANVIAAGSRRACRYKGMPAADYVRIECRDTGTGIPAEIVDKIFEPFFSTKEVGKGTGLGLSTVYGIVKQTGGFIYVDSEPARAPRSASSCRGIIAENGSRAPDHGRAANGAAQGAAGGSRSRAPI